MALERSELGRDFTLFLDRDGVINRRLPDEYVRKWEEFEFLPGVLGALAACAPRFERIVVVTNQRGIARALMTEVDLAVIHERMLNQIREHGGRVDGVYHCPHDRGAGCACRKPGIGLALAAQREFPSIDFARSIMLGDTESDMQFAERAGMLRVFVGNDADRPTTAPNLSLPSLAAFAAWLAT